MKTLPVILALLLYLAGNLYIFLRLWQALPCHHPLLKWGIITGGTLLATSILLAFLLSSILSTSLAGILYSLGTTWIFIFLYLLLATLARDLFLWIDDRVHLLPDFPSKPRVTYLVATAIVVAALLGGHACYLLKKRVELTVDTGKLPPGESIKLVLVSDLHLGHNTGARELARWVDLVNAEYPDVILIAGDIIDSDPRPLEESRAWEWLQRLEARWGVYACPGNHEYIANIDRSLRLLRQAGIRVLRDTVINVAGAFLLVGRDDRQNPRRASLQELTRDLDRDALPVVLLDHQPFHLREAVASGVDLQLSGHTHHGQVWPINWITDHVFELAHGYKQDGRAHFYVTSGIGLWGGKFRVGTRSEYVVIHLK